MMKERSLAMVIVVELRKHGNSSLCDAKMKKEMSRGHYLFVNLFFFFGLTM